MSVQIERRRAERRQAERNSDEELSPEYLALLEVCGGEIRAADRAVLAERRQSAPAEAARPEGKNDDAGDDAPPPSDRRRRDKV